MSSETPVAAAAPPEPEWRRAAMPQARRFQEHVDIKFDHDITVHATQSINTGSCLWDAAIVLGSLLTDVSVFPPGFWHGKRVCEIGAGCGVTGIVAAQLGAKVVLTELDFELKLLERNMNDNPVRPSPHVIDGSQTTGSTETKEFFWGNDPSDLGAPFDVVLAADCVYELQLFDLLAKALVDITDKNTVTYFCIEHRWTDIERWWWQEVGKHFSYRLLPKPAHSTYIHPKIDVYELKRKQLRQG